MEFYEPEAEAQENIYVSYEKDEIKESKSYSILLLNEEYELTMNLSESYIEFKLQQNNIIVNYYYQDKYDLTTINELFNICFKEIKEVFYFYDKNIKENKVKLIYSKDNKFINLNYINTETKI